MWCESKTLRFQLQPRLTDSMNIHDEDTWLKDAHEVVSLSNINWKIDGSKNCNKIVILYFYGRK